MQGQPARLELQRPDGRGGNLIDEGVLPMQSLTTAELDDGMFDRLGLGLAKPPALLGEIMAGGAAAEAGLRAGDLILAIDGKPVADGLRFIEAMQASPGRSLLLDVLRDGRVTQISVTPRADASGDRMVGRIRAQVDMSSAMVIVDATPVEAVVRAARKTWDTSVMTVTMLGKMLMGEASLKNITGPITIADYAGQTARVGWISFLSFMAFISISLGVMNLLPIPVLDGGHLLYYALELLTGRPLPDHVSALAQRAGIGLLMALMAVAMFNDIARLIG
jgi:regulator of sigma E protease